MKTYLIGQLPLSCSKLARAVFTVLDGTLYIRGGKLIMTDEADDLENPRGEFDTLEKLEDWLIGCLAEWLLDGKDDPQVEAIESLIRPA